MTKTADRVVRATRKALIHAIADCVVCGKHWEDYLTAQNRAAAHARRTGHKVMIDIGYVVEYGGNARAEAKRRKRK